MKTGFEILRARPITDCVDVDRLETKYQLKLPTLYKFFIQTYYLGEKNIHTTNYYDEQYKSVMRCESYTFERYPLVEFSHFNEIERAFEIWGSGALDDTIYEKKYFPIGAGNLWVGTEENADKIFYDGDLNPRFVMVADNIFEFVRGIIVKEAGGYFELVEKEKLKMNWGDQYWHY